MQDRAHRKKAGTSLTVLLIHRPAAVPSGSYGRVSRLIKNRFGGKRREIHALRCRCAYRPVNPVSLSLRVAREFMFSQTGCLA